MKEADEKSNSASNGLVLPSVDINDNYLHKHLSKESLAITEREFIKR